MAKDQKRKSGSDLPSGNAPSLPAPGHPLTTSETGRFKKAEVFFQAACMRLDSLSNDISKKMAEQDAEIPFKSESMFMDYVNRRFFHLFQKCKDDLFSQAHVKYLDKVNFGFQQQFEHKLQVLQSGFRQARIEHFLTGIKNFAKEYEEAIKTNNPDYAEALKSKDALLTAFNWQVTHRRSEAEDIFAAVPKEVRDHATKQLDDLLDHARFLLTATFKRGTFQSSLLDTPSIARVNPPTDELKALPSINLDAVDSQPVVSEDAHNTKRLLATRKYLPDVKGMNAADMQRLLQQAHASSNHLKQLFPDFLDFFIFFGAQLAVQQKHEDEEKHDALAFQLGGTMYDELSKTLDEEHYSSLSQNLGGSIYDEWKRDVDVLYADWDVAKEHNDQLDLGATMADGLGTMYDELSQELGGTMYDELSKSLGGSFGDEYLRHVERLHSDWDAAIEHHAQLALGTTMAQSLGTMYDELSQELGGNMWDELARDYSAVEKNDWQLASKEAFYDTWSTELETEFGQTWHDHYHDEWAADLSAAAKTPITKSLLERVEESQKYTQLSKEEYQRVKDTIVANILPDAKMISGLPSSDASNRWGTITQGLRAKLMEYVGKGEYAEGDFQEFLETEVQTLEFLIATQVAQEEFQETPHVPEPVAYDKNSLDALFGDDFETMDYEQNRPETPIIPLIDDSPVATIPKDLYTPPVKVEISQRSDEKGAEATSKRVTPMTTQKEPAESQNTSTISNLYRLVEDRLNIKKTEWKTLLTESTFETSLDTENLLDTEMALFISNIEHADGKSITQGMSALSADKQMDMYHALVNYGVEYVINRSKEVAKAQTTPLETKLTSESTNIYLVEANTKKYSPVDSTPTQPKSYMGKILIGLGLVAGAVTLGLVIKSCNEKQDQNYKQEIVQKAEAKAEAAKAEIKAEFVATHSTLENYLSSFYLNDVEAAHKMWPTVEAQFPSPGVSTDVAPVYARFAAELKTATSPKDALTTFRSYRSFLQQDLNNGSLTKDQFDASLGQALRDLNMGEYK